MIPRVAAFLTLVLILLGAGALAPALGPFSRGLAACLVLGAAALWSFRVGYRWCPRRRTMLEGVAIGSAGSFGLLFLYQNVLAHDALWYYGYLRSAIVQRSLGLYDEFVLMNSHGMYLPPPETPLIHLGTTLLQAPVALLLRPLALLLGRAGIVPGGDGFGPLEIGAATWTSLMLGIGGVALVHRLARPVSGGAASAVSQVALLYASPLAFFTFVWPAYPHAASVFLGSLFLLVWIGDGPGSGRPRTYLLGLLAGLLALVRPQDVVYLALPGLDLLLAGVTAWRRAGGKRELGGLLRTGGLLGLGTLTGFLPQMAGWLGTAGKPLAHVYSEIGDPFRWTRPAFGSVLFSGYNGLISWTPLCGLAVCGLFLLRRSHPRLFRGLALLLALQWWAIASYGYWWGGASFGARYFLSAYPVFGVGLAILLRRISGRIGLLATGLATVPFVFWNLLLMAQFRLEWIPHNLRPDFVEILRRQLFEAPRVWISALSGSFRWNQVLMVELFSAAWESGSWMRLAGWAMLAAALVAVLLLWVHRLGVGGARAGAGARPSPPPAQAAFAAACMVLVALAVAGVAGRPGFGERRIRAELRPTPLRLAPDRIETRALVADSSGPTPQRPTAVRAAAAGEPTVDHLSLDLISFLHNGESRAQGELIGRVWIRGRGCDDQPMRLRAGFETAETAPERVEIAARMSHGIEQARVIQSWWQRYQSARPYWGHAYLASWELPPGCEPEGVEIRTTGGVGDLEIRRLVVAVSSRPAPARRLAGL